VGETGLDDMTVLVDVDKGEGRRSDATSYAQPLLGRGDVACEERDIAARGVSHGDLRA
jgi:hypothetical protein